MITLTSISTNLRRLAATMTVLTVLLGLLASCSDELSGPDVPQDGAPGLSLRLNLPTASALGEAGNPDSPIFQATAEECRVNSLRFFAFPVDGNGDFVSETLDPGRDFTHERWQNYQIEITPGNYHVYVVANLDVSDVMNEAALKAKILRYRNGDEVVLPEAGNIPMVYEPQGDNAIVVIDKTQTELSASLQFTCVKVDLNLIFDIDNEDTKAQFGNHRLRLTAINGKKLSEATTLVWGGDYSARPSGKGKESFEVENVSVGKYFTSWTRTDENAGVTDKTVINDLDGESSDNKSQLDKWLFRSTLYLPERYVATDGEQSELEVEGELLDEVGNPIDIRTKFMIPLGHGKTQEDVRVFPRSTYYEIIGDIVSLGEMDLNLFVAVREWWPETLLAEFIHTTLAVSKTRASVSSKNTDYITYETNAFKVEFGCEATVDINGEDLPHIVAYKHDEDNRRIEFHVNPAIPLSAFGNGEGKYPQRGTEKVYIQAGNIKKYIDVDYEVGPYFEVTPLEEIIQWSTDPEVAGTTLVRQFKFETNLGGIVVEDAKGTEWTLTGFGKDDLVGNSNIHLSCDNQNIAVGYITVKATTDPVTTTVHEFHVRPVGFDDNSYADLGKDITVIVRPDNTDYRVYFRAINDRQDGWWNKNADTRFKVLTPNYGRVPEGGENNWDDGWSVEHPDSPADGCTKMVCVAGYDSSEGWMAYNNIEGIRLNYFILNKDDGRKYYYYKFPENSGDINLTAYIKYGNAKQIPFSNTSIKRGVIKLGGEDKPDPKDEMYNPLGTSGDLKNTDRHRLYAYTQLGETLGEIPADVWPFTAGFPGDEMTADNTNTGWYYKDLSATMEVTNNAGQNAVKKMVKPGETLLIFDNKEHAITSHRCTHHMEPGIPLFDYEDREGWIVYDPSSSPEYRIYDEKPTIIDVDYTIYTRKEIAAWCHMFGMADNISIPQMQLTMWDIADCSNLGNGWWRTVIKLKAIKGEEEKHLYIKFMPDGGAGKCINLTINENNDRIELFGGRNFASSNNTGYYDGSTWKAGSPF